MAFTSIPLNDSMPKFQVMKTIMQVLYFELKKKSSWP